MTTIGSSPRGRGTRKWGFERAPCQRFIPARAGNTCSRSPTASASPVHPRAGGEHEPPAWPLHNQNGSSPRGRGTPFASYALSPTYRFIPARAGNTGVSLAIARLKAVHPRAGGEHYSSGSFAGRHNGSSPRGRGTRSEPRDDYPGRRFIPARAGNTAASAMPRPAMTVHPRAGGEHFGPIADEYSLPGSSPRGRGTRLQRPMLTRLPRFIPARAGNTSSRRATKSR